MKLPRFVLTVALVLGLNLGPATPAAALDADELGPLLGYTMIAYTNVRGEFEGADFDKPVVLDNGWIFEFTEYNYSYSYHPSVAVFAKTIPLEDLKKVRPGATKPITLYQLVIEDEVYSAIRVR